MPNLQRQFRHASAHQEYHQAKGSLQAAIDRASSRKEAITEHHPPAAERNLAQNRNSDTREAVRALSFERGRLHQETHVNTGDLNRLYSSWRWEIGERERRSNFSQKCSHKKLICGCLHAQHKANPYTPVKSWGKVGPVTRRAKRRTIERSEYEKTRTTRKNRNAGKSDGLDRAKVWKLKRGFLWVS